MKAVILAAGVGKRMLPLTSAIPKSLLRVGNQTILDGIFDSLPKEIDEVIMVVGYLKKKIQEHVGVRYQGRTIRYVVQETLNGTAVALFCCRDLFAPGERFLVIYGDELPMAEEIIACLARPYTWLCYHTDHPEQSGIATVDSMQRIISVEEKPLHPASNLAATGVMVIDTSIFAYPLERHANGEFYLSSLMNHFLPEHEVYAVYGEQRPGFNSPDEMEKIILWKKAKEVTN